MSAKKNLVLYAATYADGASARADFDELKAAEGPDLLVVGAIVMSRDASGGVDVLEAGDGDTAAGAMLGGGAGLVVGLFAPPLLASTAIGAGIGALLGHLTKKHEEKELGVELDEYFPGELVSGRRGRGGRVSRPCRGGARQGRQAGEQGDRPRRLRQTGEGRVEVG